MLRDGNSESQVGGLSHRIPKRVNTDCKHVQTPKKPVAPHNGYQSRQSMPGVRKRASAVVTDHEFVAVPHDVIAAFEPMQASGLDLFLGTQAQQVRD